MRRFALAAAILLVAGVLLVMFVPSSDEDLIRDLLDEMAAGFNAAQPGVATVGFADQVRLSSESVERRLLIGHAFGFFERHKLPGGAPRYDAEVLHESSSVEVDREAEPPSARVRVKAIFTDMKVAPDDARRLAPVQVALVLTEIDGEWRITEVGEIVGDTPFR